MLNESITIFMLLYLPVRGNFHGNPVVKILHFQLQEVWVWSLVRELRPPQRVVLPPPPKKYIYKLYLNSFYRQYWTMVNQSYFTMHILETSFLI